MKLLDRLFRRTETRAQPIVYSPRALGGGYVNAVVAENLSGVLACVGAISSTLSTLPARVYQVQAEGRTEVPNHPVSRLIRAPNDRQTWPDWLETTMASALLHGNAVSVMEHDGAGRLTALTPVPWQGVLVSLLPSGRLVYDITQGYGQSRRFLQDEVFHLKDRSDDGFVGRSRISRAEAVLQNAVSLADYSVNQWINGGTPSGVLKFQNET